MGEPGNHEGNGAAAAPIGPVDPQEIPRFAGIRTFARLPTLDSVTSAALAVLGVPFDGGTTFRSGARFGPSAIREASILLRPYSEGLDIAPFEVAQVADAGDATGSPLDLDQVHGAIAAAAQRLTGRGTRILGLGGDHSVSLPLLRATADAFGPLSLIQFDAHTDTWDAFFGSKVTHGTIFRRAAEEGLIDPRRSIQVGLRGSLYDAGDYAENRALGFSTVLAREFDSIGCEGTLEAIRSTATLPAYVTVDVDVLDPAFAPGTGTPEPGGLSSRELLAMLRGLVDLAEPIAGADVVEVLPAFDSNQVTAVAAANIGFELLALLANKRIQPRPAGAPGPEPAARPS